MPEQSKSTCQCRPLFWPITIAIVSALLVAGWLIYLNGQEPTVAEAPVDPVKQKIVLPPSITAIQGSDAVPMKVLMVAWGMPGDDGLSPPSRILEYSKKLTKLMTDIATPLISRPVTFDYHYIKDADRHGLMNDEPKYWKSAELCSEVHADLLVFGFVEGPGSDGSAGFIAARRPFISVFDCKTGKGTLKRSDVESASGDRFPYEKGLTRVFRSFMQQESVFFN